MKNLPPPTSNPSPSNSTPTGTNPNPTSPTASTFVPTKIQKETTKTTVMVLPHGVEFRWRPRRCRS
ncbi:hypothetical protein glysoja_024368 [Glycine soja]|uniref:Uncharacterized protein n=1 Tax=Glycine soja TaxID=3848 RepID=A0A0B2NUW0_GLYSO|nr:hypothetical protein glysoja_024368 [Glycine soja]